MKVWIDALTPKQLIFFYFVSQTLFKRGCEVWVTTREYHDSSFVVKRMKIHAETVGRHGGKSLKEKLTASLERSIRLVPLVIDKNPDLSISFSSPEAARVSTGLGLKHVAVNDSPHSQWVARLTIPLSSHLFSPWVIPAKAWYKYGIDRKRVTTYRALDPAVWLKRRELWPEPTDFELSADGCIIIRTAETQASYMMNQNFSLINTAKLLSERFRDKKIILLPRYEEQEEELQKIDEPNIVVCREPFFGPNLLSKASLLIGGGGTMNAEASLLGVPVLSFYQGPATYVENYLIKSGFVKKVRSVKECVREATLILEDKLGKELASRAQKELSLMEDPSQVIADRIEEIQKG